MHQTVVWSGIEKTPELRNRFDTCKELISAGAAETPRAKKRRAAGSLSREIIIVGRFLKRQICVEEGVNAKPGGGRM